MRITWIAGALILLIPLLAGCGSVERMAEQEIVNAAPRFIGPADRYDADVVGLGTTTAERVVLMGFNVRPDPNITLDTVNLAFSRITFQRDPFRITNIGNATFSIRVTQQAVNRYLTSQADQRVGNIPLRDVQITFLPDQVRASGVASLSGVVVPFSTTGTLQPQGDRVRYNPTSVSISGVTVDNPILLATMAQYVNPLLTLSGLRFEPTIQEITLAENTMVITGSANANQIIEELQE